MNRYDQKLFFGLFVKKIVIKIQKFRAKKLVLKNHKLFIVKKVIFVQKKVFLAVTVRPSEKVEPTRNFHFKNMLVKMNFG